MAHTCKACVVTCIDFRFQEFIDGWVKEKFGTRNHDRIAFAGGVKSLGIITEQIGLSKKLHNIQDIILINHEDCGAYGAEGTIEKHSSDLQTAATQIQEQIPGVNIETYYLHLDGNFEQVN